MNSKHRDPCSSPSACSSTPQSSKVAKGRLLSEESTTTTTTPRGGGGSGSGSGKGRSLIVVRGLYKVLEQEMLESKSPRKCTNSRGAGQASRPSFLLCYLCGQQFGSSSLSIHQPQCYIKKLIEWERMDPLRRGPRPLDPEAHEEQIKLTRAAALGTTGVASSSKIRGRDVEHFNELQMQSFNNNMLSKCENCGRTFLPDRLVVHQRSCKPGLAGASKPVTRSSRGCAAEKKTPPMTRAMSTGANWTRNSAESGASDERPLRQFTMNSGRTKNDGMDLSSLHEATSSCDSRGAAFLSEKDPLAETRPGEDPDVPLDATASDTRSITLQVVLSPTESEKQLANEGGRKTGPKPVADTKQVSAAAAGAVAQRETRGDKRGVDDFAPAVVKERHEGSRLRGRSATGAGARSSFHTHIDASTTSPAFPATPSASAASAAHHSNTPEGEDTPSRSMVKIHLNNVSRFKSVPSRLNLGSQKPQELPRCHYCNRTFNADRLSKHEQVCLERNGQPKKQPASTVSASHDIPSKNKMEGSSARTPKAREDRNEKSEGATAKATAAATDEVSPAPSIADATPSKCGSSATKSRAKGDEGKVSESTKQRFCMDCGAKLQCGTQRFCAECGAKLLT